jgi:hypothetical protein
LNVTFAFDDPDLPKKAFCRFGLVSVTATFVSKSSLKCFAPAGPPQSLKVAISFDGIHWSAEDFSFVTFREFTLLDWLPLGCLYVGVVALLAVFVRRAFGPGKKERKGEEERVPFVATGQDDAMGRKRKGRRKRSEP